MAYDADQISVLSDGIELVQPSVTVRIPLPGSGEVVSTLHRYMDIGTAVIKSTGVHSEHVLLWEMEGSFWSHGGASARWSEAIAQEQFERRVAALLDDRNVTAVQHHRFRITDGGISHLTSATKRTLDQPPKSPWADAIGPLFTIEAAADETGLTLEAVRSSIDAHCLIAIASAEGNLLLPVAQFNASGRPLPGISWIARRLAPLMDPYALAAWLNRERSELAARKPWSVLRDDEWPNVQLQELVLDLKHRLEQ